LSSLVKVGGPYPVRYLTRNGEQIVTRTVYTLADRFYIRGGYAPNTYFYGTYEYTEVHQDGAGGWSTRGGQK